MKTVVDCLLTLKSQFMSSGGNLPTFSTITKPGSIHGDALSCGSLTPLSGEERRKASSDLKFQRALHTPLMSGNVLFLPAQACLCASLCLLVNVASVIVC